MPESKYKILYVDDEQSASDDFKRAFREFADEFDVQTTAPNELLDGALHARLQEKDFDYLVVDFQLNEKGHCGYEGDTILRNFLLDFPYFPVMLLTNHDEAAIDSVRELEVDLIHDKKEYSNMDFRDAFMGKIKAKVDAYKSRLVEAERDLQSIVAKKIAGQELTAEEEESVIKLDMFLDEANGGRTAFAIPDELKKMSNDSRITELLDKTNDLISRLKKYETVQE